MRAMRKLKGTELGFSPKRLSFLIKKEGQTNVAGTLYSIRVQATTIVETYKKGDGQVLMKDDLETLVDDIHEADVEDEQPKKGGDDVPLISDQDVSEDGYNSCEEVDIPVGILEGDMEWLERSFIVLFNASTDILVAKEIIFNSGCKVDIRIWSNVMLVVMVEE
ncbi:hypothetical protein COLO4_24699 [Corchorus olitorius]|uniref:Uncharacterized protein n=1 Tax=Corchorus olitorius TaxID=93759 RepID=A0A1R3I7N0_9ROSI|nr:hypothetical protein COLO4_24699 [Corchorus olitorius]